ncbi:type II toxin-antitoxin system VapC family toxin [soil metagenome]
MMIGVDTNVLLRYLLPDEDRRQGKLATALLSDASARGEPVFVSCIVLCELVWTLRSSYKLPKGDVLAVLHQILARADSTAADSDAGTPFVVEDRVLLEQAVADYAAGRADFADHLIGRLAKASGATTTYTFDRTAAATASFKLLRAR